MYSLLGVLEVLEEGLSLPMKRSNTRESQIEGQLQPSAESPPPVPTEHVPSDTLVDVGGGVRESLGLSGLSAAVGM